jgi:predicted DNA-binding transcriptional regulator AlpA
MAKQYLKIDQVAEITGLSVQTIYRRSRLKTFPEPEKIEGQKGGKQWVRTDVTKWVKANAKPDEEKIVKLEPKEQAKAEADDAMVLGAMLDDMSDDAESFFEKHKWTIYAVAAGVAAIIVASWLT